MSDSKKVDEMQKELKLTLKDTFHNNQIGMLQHQSDSSDGSDVESSPEKATDKSGDVNDSDDFMRMIR